MSEVANTTAYVEAQLAKAKKAKAQLDRFERLESNKDFKELILEQWCIRDAASFASASVLPLTDRERANALGNAQAPGYFSQWVHSQKANLRTAIQSIEGLESDLAHLNSQQAEEDQAADEGASPADLVV